MEVRVEYEYTAEQPDELTIKKGDIITDVVQKLDGWWEGTLGGRRGLFPDNFVKIMSKSSKDDDVFDDSVQLRKKPSARRLKALFSYSPEQDDELALQVGDIIDFVAEVEDGWWKGSVNGKAGIFPSNFVTEVELPVTNGTSQMDTNKNADSRPVERARAIPDVVPTEGASVEDEPAPKLPPKPVRELARCFYPYSAQNEDELELQEGDIVTIISKNCEDEGWWRGELRGKTGLFPDNFVRLIPPSEMPTTNSTSSLPVQQKIPTQAGESSAVPVSRKEAVSPAADSSVVDGAVSSKKALEKELSKKLPLKAERESPPKKPLTPPSPVSPPSGGFSYLNAFGLKVGLKKEPKQKEEPPAAAVTVAATGEVGEFNAVERNSQQLNHLTANRAKPPNRRPPSDVRVSRDSDSILQNGGTAPDSLESPHNNSTTSNGGLSPLGNSFNSSGRMDSTTSTAVISDSSGLSTPGNRFSFSRDQDSSPQTGYSGTPTSVNPPPKPKQVLPWMTELKQTQDKKRQATSPVASTTSSPSSTVSSTVNAFSSNTNATTSPALSSIPSLRSRDRDSGGSNLPQPTSKAPPLPAKPVLNAEKVAPTTIGSIATTPVVTTSTVSMRLGRKTPTTSSTVSSIASNYVNTVVPPTGTNATSANNVNNNSTGNANANNSYINANNTTDGPPSTAVGKGGANPAFVPYEEHARLKDRVFFLESELEAVKKQLKLLLDRDLNRGHIV